MRRLVVMVSLVTQSLLVQAFGYTLAGGVVGAWAGVQLYEFVLEVAAAMPAPAASYGPTPLPSRTPNGSTDANARFPLTPIAHA